jgi:hypothetical protein
MNCTPSTFPPDFLTNSVTETENGVACIDWVYFIHIITAYICVAAGGVALVCRVVPPWKRFHRYAGLVFMLTMYYTEGSATLIYNTGLPRAIIFFLTLMVFCMTIGFAVIKVAQQRFQNAVMKVVDQLPAEKGEKVSHLMARATAEVASVPRTWYQRLFSLKALHGYLMSVAYYQMAGRAMVTNPVASWDHCWVYPVSKELGPNGELVLLPGISEEEKAYQVSFALWVTLPAVTCFALIGIGYVLATDWWARFKNSRKPILDEADDVQ